MEHIRARGGTGSCRDGTLPEKSQTNLLNDLREDVTNKYLDMSSDFLQVTKEQHPALHAT